MSPFSYLEDTMKTPFKMILGDSETIAYFYIVG
jgi:hypothetical protein